MEGKIWNLLLLPYLSGMATQIIKFLNYFIASREISFRKLRELGGMPSTHSTSSITLTTLMGIYYGMNSPLFVISLFISAIVMVEAVGVRRIAGSNALVLNQILDKLPDREAINSEMLDVPVGHTPLEVIMGSMFGFTFAFAFAGGI